MAKKSAERIEFLSDLLCGAVENGGYGFFYTITWECPEGDPAAWYAHIIAKEDSPDDEVLADIDVSTDKRVHRIDLDTMARGLGVIQRSVLREVTEGHDKGEKVLHNLRTDKQLYLSEHRRKVIRSASFANDAAGTEVGDLDVLDYLAILECALFGAVTYV